MARPELVRDPAPEPPWPPELPRPALAASGELWTFTTRFDRDFRHGPWSIGEMARRPTGDLSRLAGRREEERLEWLEALFLDLETGPHVRGGVSIHLAGCGRFVEGRLEVRQYAARSEEGEPALLAAVARDAAAAGDLVTYAGKSFDAPLLAERARACDVELALPRRHVDLYRVAAKLLRRRFADARLVTLERELLRYERPDELGGAAAACAWREGGGEGGSAWLPAILRHNLLDVLALPALAAELTLRLECPQELLEQGRLDEREAGELASALEEARRELATAPPHRVEAARRRVRRIERRLEALRAGEAS